MITPHHPHHPRRRFPVVIALLTVLGACALQPPAIPTGCQRQGMQTIEVGDNFTGPTPVPYVSPALSTFLGSLPTTQQFDESKNNAAFGASFRIDAGAVCSVRMDVAVRRSGNGWLNDGITVGVAPYGSNDPRFYSAVIWKSGDPPTKVLSFYLSTLTVNNYLNGTVPPIDVYLQDDTNVDYIRVAYTY